MGVSNWAGNDMLNGVLKRCVALLCVAWSSCLLLADSVEAPRLRLPAIAQPQRVHAELTIDPAAAEFSGIVEIDLQFLKPSSFLWLNADDLKIKDVTLIRAKKSVKARAVQDQPDYVRVDFAEVITPGDAKLRITYTGILNTVNNYGVFKEKEGDDWYVFTFFEPMNARRAFPCFDEPSYKIPWQLTLHIPSRHLGFSNTNPESESHEASGMKTILFHETKPLPSYLVAFAVGPFEIVDAGKAGRNRTQLRIITPRGKSDQARYAAETCPPLFELLENFFDIPYPYEKLDQIAVPQTGFAMENPGLITYWQTGLLAPREQQTLEWKESYASVIAHEMSHQWFGDLVTLSWWNEIWLNESFASWVSRKITDQWKPEWKISTSVYVLDRARTLDSLISARKIRQPIESNDDIQNYVDFITYSKGESILLMFERWIGEEKFRKGVQRYLKAHFWGNATTEDFLAAMSAEIGVDPAPAFNSFLDQGGVPLVAVRLSCENGSAVLTAHQERYLPAGSQGNAAQTWQIPFCVRYGDGDVHEQACALLNKPDQEIQLKTGACPNWLVANANATGYYYVQYDDRLANDLVTNGIQELTTRERLGVLSDFNAMVRAGKMSIARVLSVIPEFLKDPDPQILDSTIDIVLKLDPDLISPELRLKYQSFVRNLYGKRVRQLGWRSRPDEDLQTTLVRPRLLSLVAIQGQDPELIAEATKLAKQWLSDRSGVAFDVLPDVLRIAARNGDRALFDEFIQNARQTDDLKEKRLLIGTTADFIDPELHQEALRLMFSKDFDPRDSFDTVRSDEPENWQSEWEFFKQNYDAILKLLPGDDAAGLPRLSARFCDEQHKTDVQSFWQPRVSKIEGAPRNLNRTLETISLCQTFRDAHLKEVADFLNR